MDPKVAILLPTYNGEQYIVEQLDSIWSQDYSNIKVIIRDDGSTDQTVRIIRDYIRDKEVTFIEGRNVGVINGIFCLLNLVPDSIEYVAFCDQDDVWKSNKISTAISLLEDENKDVPTLYCSSVQPVDENLYPLKKKIHLRNIEPSFGNALVENICTGCTAVINRKMIEILANKKPNFTIMHDFWIYLVASCFGKVIYDTTAHILYRQHVANQIGLATNMFENYKRRIRNFKKHRGQLIRQAREFMSIYDTIPEENKEMLINFILSKKSIKARIGILLKGEIYRQRKSDNIIFKMLILLGWT